MLPDGFYQKTEFLLTGDTVRAVCRFSERVRATAELAGVTYPDVGNLCEPFDPYTPIFTFPRAALEAAGAFSLTVTGRGKKNVLCPIGTTYQLAVPFSPAAVVPLEAAKARQQRNLKKEEILQEGGADGVRYEIARWRTAAENAPVVTYLLRLDLSKVTFTAATPDGETTFVPGRVQTVMEEIAVVEAAGDPVLAAVNADFFDMFGDCAPSGLSVHKGAVVAPGKDPTRPFLARLQNGAVGIFRPGEVDLADVAEAVAGKQIILADGELCELAPLERFGETPHPRTAAGVTADGGTLLLLVVDGRRPDWSNGATLADLATILREAGAARALNLDGGGSSTFIVREESGFVMKNQPADLYRPTEDLVRPLFNAVLVIPKPLFQK